MKLSDIRDLNKDDVLAALGLTSKPSTSEVILGRMSMFGLGLLVGVGAALLLAPKSGEDLREDLGNRLRDLRAGVREKLEAAGDHPGTNSGKSREESINT